MNWECTPPPAICNTSNTIAMALPGLPSNDTHVYTIELKIIEQKIVISTNNTGDSTPALGLTNLQPIQ